LIILLFGPPGCGKGTQAAFLARRFHVPAISTGEIFRAECRAGTRLGRQACDILNAGGLVGDDLVNQIVEHRLRQPDCTAGFLLDGYPRTLPQAIFLDEWMEGHGLGEPLAIHISVPPSVLVERITARLTCRVCQRVYNLRWQPPRQAGLCDADHTPLIRREDDSEPVILARLQAYEQAIGPVLAHYRGHAYVRVDGTGTPEQISQEIERRLAGVLV
jgi:adenylate kinase